LTIEYAVNLLMADDQTAKINQAFEITHSILPKIGASPHICLALFDNVEVDTLCSLVTEFVKEVEPLTIHFGSFGIFPSIENTLFLAPVVTMDLLILHSNLHKRLWENKLHCLPNYLPGAWVPHCTITMDEPWENCVNNLELIHGLGLLGDYQFDRMDVVEFRPVKKFAELKLGKRI
jgi:2'-5' RNA ligase superfamily